MNPLTAEIATAQNSDNKLILIIGGPGSGKSKLIHDYSNETGIPILNLDQIFKDDCSEIITVMNDFIDNYDKEVLLLDNKRVLYAKDSNIDMLTFLKELAKKSETLGYDTEIYHCSFDPESLDMVLIPQLNICFFDSTAPHEYFPSLETDEVIDTYEALITPGTDEANADRLAEIASLYKATIKKGTTALGEAKKLHDVLEEIYIKAMNFQIIEGIYEQIKSEIYDLIK